MELAQPADVVDVRVRAYNGFHRETAPTDQVKNPRHFIARVDHQRLARKRIADDRAIALQHAQGNGDMNQTVMGRVQRRHAIPHSKIITLEFRSIPRSIARGSSAGTAMRPVSL